MKYAHTLLQSLPDVASKLSLLSHSIAALAAKKIPFNTEANVRLIEPTLQDVALRNVGVGRVGSRGHTLLKNMYNSSTREQSSSGRAAAAAGQLIAARPPTAGGGASLPAPAPFGEAAQGAGPRPGGAGSELAASGMMDLSDDDDALCR